MIKICSLNSSMLYMKIELLNFCEGHSYFLWNRDWVPVIKAIVSILKTFDKASGDKLIIVKGQRAGHLLLYNWLCFEEPLLGFFSLHSPPLFQFSSHFLFVPY